MKIKRNDNKGKIHYAMPKKGDFVVLCDMDKAKGNEWHRTRKKANCINCIKLMRPVHNGVR